MTKTNSFDVTHGDLTMHCRLFQRSGGFANGTWVLSGWINHEERMSCDVSVTVRRFHGARLMEEIAETAQQRLAQIAAEANQ